MSTAGIDFDTHAVHVVLLEESGAATYHRFELEGADAFDRARSVRWVMPPGISTGAHGLWQYVEAIGIEEPQGAQRATVAKLKAVQGAVLACLPRDLLVQPLQPAQWRVACGLAGNATKLDVAHFVNVARLQFEMKQDGDSLYTTWGSDACDAFAIAYALSRMVVAA